MNAELAFWLVERGLDVEDAKDVASTATVRADIVLGLVEHAQYSIADARTAAEQAPLVVEVTQVGNRQVVTPSRPDPVPPLVSAGPVMGEHDTDKVAHGTYTPVVGPDGLTDKQRSALGKVGLCPNCQQPNNDHLPGCARVSTNGYEPMDPKARTKDPLPPAV